jgi:hypothetical protein
VHQRVDERIRRQVDEFEEYAFAPVILLPARRISCSWRLANRGVTNDAKAPIAEPHNTEIAEI